MPYFRQAALILLVTTGFLGAEVTGKWQADLETPQGKVKVHYVFQQEGETVTGTWQTAQSPTVQIEEGKVSGDKISFVVKVRPNNGLTLVHEGTITGDEIRFVMKPSGEFPG